MSEPGKVFVRNTRLQDFPAIAAICRRVYPGSAPWSEAQLSSHLEVFPEGQLVAVDPADGEVVGMAASLIVDWDDYEVEAAWRDMTDAGMFTNHDPEYGRTLYGAEVMVDPGRQGRGVGKALYAARRELTERLNLIRIRAGARLRDYHRWADRLSPEEYVRAVLRGEIGDRTLSFQISRGFHVLAVVGGYLNQDPESLGYAALIEWINPKAASAEQIAAGARARTRFGGTSEIPPKAEA